MRERPILFSAPMVRALLAGTKTQTRRIYKNRKHPDFGCDMAASELVREQQHVIDRICPYGQPGDRLWVRETTINVEEHGYVGPVYVESEEGCTVLDFGLRPSPDDMTEVEPEDIRNRPSIHMPRAMSRITLEITGVRVERLNDISEADAIAEGVERVGGATSCTPWKNYSAPADAPHAMNHACARASYRSLWEQINGDGSWALNPWVWVVEFKRVQP